MKKLITFITILLLVITLSSCCFATNTTAETNTDTSDTNTLLGTYSTDYEYIYSDLYLYDEDIEANQVIDGNVFIIGTDITVSGIIYGDLFVLATNSLTINNTTIAYGNIYAFSPNIIMSGATSDVYFLSENLVFGDSGYTSRNLNVYSTSIALKGTIARNANLYTSNLIIDDSTTIEGNLNYSSTTEAEINEDLVSGDINYTKIQQSTNNIALSILYSSISTLLFAFALIMLLFWISPKFQERASDIVSKKLLLSLGIGLLAFFGIIIVAFILLLFTYGFASTLAVVLIGLLILAYSISQTIFSIGLGKFICNKLNMNKTISYVLFSLLIVLIIKLLSYVPYVGGFIGFATSIIGLGMLFINTYKRKDLVVKSE